MNVCRSSADRVWIEHDKAFAETLDLAPAYFH